MVQPHIGAPRYVVQHVPHGHHGLGGQGVWGVGVGGGWVGEVVGGLPCGGGSAGPHAMAHGAYSLYGLEGFFRALRPSPP